MTEPDGTEHRDVREHDGGTFDVRIASWPEDMAALRELRSQVFIEEQGVPADIEWDGRDETAQHVVAEHDGQVLGCGRLLSDGRIGRLAVLPDHRGRGIGLQMLSLLVQLAKEGGLGQVYLHAQKTAVAFYARAGFEARGESFQEAGIEHQDMQQTLDYTEWSSSLPRVSYPDPFAQLAACEAQRAGRELRILSPDLDPRVFDQEAFLDAVRQLVRRGRMSRILIIVKDPRALTSRGHGMLNLARRMPSSIEIRKLSEHPAWNDRTLLIRDRAGLLSLAAGERSRGVFRPHARAECESAIHLFEDLWRAASVDPEFRSLSL